jgi:hypothetical protein
LPKSVAMVLKLFCAFVFIGNIIVGCLSLKHFLWYPEEIVCVEIFIGSSVVV